ncbi:MAG: epoxyqueuosine reductase [Syntrophales bacterium]|jgi:epoxyqueuosine reductase QueG
MANLTVDKRTKRRFDSNPKRFIERAINNFVRTSPANQLASFNDQPIFDKPLIGFADGDDPLFVEFKKLVHEKHLTPREILTLHLKETLKHETAEVESVSVISFVLPIHKETRLSNAQEKEGPSLRWNHTRWQGQDFIIELSKYLVSLLESMGFSAVAPDLSPFFEILLLPGGFASKWSHRHIAYAAGLGTFSLNDGFITSQGLAVRLGSVVTNLKLEPSARPYTHYLANCLFYAKGKCGKCIRRCPGGAISGKGHDKLKCFKILYETQKPWLEGVHGQGYIGKYAGCGLCQTGVPCENHIPAAESKRRKVG